jgi:hypothetical protein
MNLTFTTFDVAFPVGLGALFGMVRYARLSQAGVPRALYIAAQDAVKGMIGAALIIFAYKSFGIL